MRFKIDGDALKKATSDVKTGLGSKKVNAFYETIYIEATEDKVIIRTRDDGIRLTALCNCQVEETGDFRCEGKLFIDIASQLNNDDAVEIYTVEKVFIFFIELWFIFYIITWHLLYTPLLYLIYYLLLLFHNLLLLYYYKMD